MKRDMPKNFSQHTYLYLPLSLTIHFSFAEHPPPHHPPPPPLHISLFLTEINPPLLVKSLMKYETLNDIQPWPSARMVTVKSNNSFPFHCYLFFSFLSFSLRLFLLYFYSFIINLCIFSIAKL